VEIVSDWTTYNGKKARLVLAINKDQEDEIQRAKEMYYKKLNDYAFFASHNLREPVASVLGLIELLNLEEYSKESLSESIDHLKLAAHRLDKVIGQLNSIVDLEDL
jgi:signal transduction histidine kinase